MPKIRPRLKIKPLTVGPIVGETTGRRARIWGRGNTNIVDNFPRRCFGVIRYTDQQTGKTSKPYAFKMNPNFDMTGVAVLTGLVPDRSYTYEIGYYFSDVELADARVSESKSDWDESSTGSFTTASEDDQRSRTLVIGSCRYLLKTFLGDFFDDRGDKTFRSILKQMDDDLDPVRVDQLIMMGDQIYADDLSALNPDKTVDQFYKRYRDAFSQKYIRQLMSRTPTYMTLDDHEIEDNWPSEAAEKDWKTLFPVAIHAYQSYQLSHSPKIRVTGRRLKGTPNGLWYQYEDGCVDVFVTDSRTERYIDDHANREMLGHEQMSKLKGWLKNGSGRVKLVVTSVPFFPDTKGGEKRDKWSGFQDQRKEILTHIEKHAIQKVVFLSGDVHASLTAQLESPTGTKIYSVVSSAFFWPYPHPSARHFQRSGTIDGGKAGKFKLSTSKIINDDNFTRLTVTPVGFTADVFARKGSSKGSVTYEF